MVDETETAPDTPEEGGDDTHIHAINLSALLDSLRPPNMRNEAHVHGSVIDQTIRLVETYAKPTLLDIEMDGISIPAVLSKDGIVGVKPALFDPWRDHPRRRIGTATMLDLSSFIAHTNRFCDPDSVVFADNDRDSPSLTAVLDYHRYGPDGDPRFGEHRSTFAFPLADEWLAWGSQNAKPMTMIEFAGFLEDRIIDVVPESLVDLSEEARRFVATLPNGKIASPARLMEIATTLRINESSMLAQANNLSSGEGELVFKTDHLDQSGQKLVLPALFVIGVPVFKGEGAYQVIARFRYRKGHGSLAFWYDLWRLDRIFDHAFDEAVARVREETKLPVLIGSDEG